MGKIVSETMCPTAAGPWVCRRKSHTAESDEDEGFHQEWSQASGVLEEDSLHAYSTGSDRGFQTLMSYEARGMLQSPFQVLNS